jgi:hypothetical protein
MLEEDASMVVFYGAKRIKHRWLRQMASRILSGINAKFSLLVLVNFSELYVSAPEPACTDGVQEYPIIPKT